MAPENTIPAIEKALDLGIPMIELDVRSSIDGVLYDLHDPTLNRTTRGRGNIRLKRSSRIEKIKVKDDHFGVDCTIPRIESILKEYGDRSHFYFDVKKGVKLTTLLNLVYKYKLEKRSLFWFKDPAQAALLKKTDPSLALKINVNSPEDLLNKLDQIPADVIEIAPEDYSEILLNICRSRKIRIMVNFLDKEEMFLEKPKKWPVDIVNVHRVLPMIPYLTKIQEKKKKKKDEN